MEMAISYTSRCTDTNGDKYLENILQIDFALRESELFSKQWFLRILPQKFSKNYGSLCFYSIIFLSSRLLNAILSLNYQGSFL